MLSRYGPDKGPNDIELLRKEALNWEEKLVEVSGDVSSVNRLTLLAPWIAPGGSDINWCYGSRKTSPGSELDTIET